MAGRIVLRNGGKNSNPTPTDGDGDDGDCGWTVEMTKRRLWIETVANNGNLHIS
jgi:hypothetical protein